MSIRNNNHLTKEQPEKDVKMKSKCLIPNRQEVRVETDFSFLPFSFGLEIERDIRCSLGKTNLCFHPASAAIALTVVRNSDSSICPLETVPWKGPIG